MPQSIILKRSALQGKVPTTSSLNLGEIAINTYDGKLYLNRSGSVQSIQEIITTNVVNTGSITLTKTGSFGELVVSQDGNFLRDIYVTQDIIGNGSIDILYDVTASAFLGTIRATNGVISGSAQLTSLNSFTASAGIRLTNLETTSASLLIETQNLELFSASALNRLTNLEIKTGSYATTGSNTFRGNQIVSGSITTSGSVSIIASGSNVFTVDGTSGRLFSIDDSLSGSLFSVNTAAGLPVIEAFSDNTIRIGQFGQRALFVSQSRVGIGKESGLNATLDVSGSAIFSGSLSVSGQFTASLQSGFALVGGPNNTSIAVATSSFGSGGVTQIVAGTNITISPTSGTGSVTINAAAGAAFPFTGSALITGSLVVTGSVTATNFTGSLFGTASWANNAVSSSYPFRVTGSGSVSIYSANAGEGTNNDYSYFIGYKAGLSASNSTYATYIGDFAGAIDNGSPTYAHAGVMIGSDAGYNANNSFLGVYIGNRAGLNATNASQSVLIGSQAGESGSQAANSVMIGLNAGYFASQSMGSIFIGASAGARAAGSYEMVAMGYTAGGGVSTTYASNAFRSVFIGSGAGGGATNASNTIALGYGSGQLATNASSSVFIGNQAGVSNSNASFSNFIGYKAGFNGGSLLGQNNTIIGTNITLPAGYSNYANIGAVLFISGTYSTITGNPSQNVSNGRVGINVINPEFNFDVSGSGRYTNGLTVTGSTAIVGDVSTGNTITVGGATNTAGVLNFFNGNVGISRSGASGLLFRVGTNNTAVTITQEKLVGIGIESPTALLHVSGTTAGLFEIDSVTVPNILYVSSSGNIGVGTITPSASLHILGTNSAATYSLWVQNSLGETLISAQNDRTVNINATNATNGGTNIGTTNGTITFVRGYNNTFIGNALTFYVGGAPATIQGFNDAPGMAIGYSQTTVNPNPGTGLSIRGTTTTSGSGVLFVTGSSSTRLLKLSSETNPNAFVVSGSGRIGINQPNPEFNFDVSGSGRYTNGLQVTGSLIAPIITGSLFGTASFANNAVTASYANSGFQIANSQFHNTSSLTTSGTTTISQLATGSYISAFYNYSIISASNARAGQIMSIWSGSTATYTEVTTTDIGNTSPASFAVNVVGSNVQLNFTAPGTWTVRTIANLL